MRQGTFQDAHKFTAKWEGGLSDHPNDRGGLTAYGASIEFVKGIAATGSGKNFLQAIGVDLPVTRAVMRQLRPGQVTTMFRREFWDALRLDELPFRQAALLYDATVNHGQATAVKLSQRGYNRCVTHGVKLAVDGILGPLTRKALQTDTDKGTAMNASAPSGSSSRAYSAAVSRSQATSRYFRLTFSTKTPKKGVASRAGRLDREKNTPVWVRPNWYPSSASKRKR